MSLRSTDTYPQEPPHHTGQECREGQSRAPGRNVLPGSTVRELTRDTEILRKANARLQAENIQYRSELKRAAEVQRRILPPPRSTLGDMQMQAMMNPSHVVSGDCYGCGPLSDDRSYFWMADVVGHGLVAALHAATIGSVVTGQMMAANRSNPPHPREVFRRINEQLLQPGQEDDSYFTMIFGTISRNENTVRLGIAGHPPPLLLMPCGQVTVVEGGGLPLALFDDVDHEQVEIDVPPGSRLLLYSDGIPECESPDGECFEIDRLVQWIGETASLETGQALDELNHRLQRWHCAESAADDVTGILIERPHTRS